MCTSVSYKHYEIRCARDFVTAGIAIQEQDFPFDLDLADDDTWDMCLCDWDIESILRRSQLKWDPAMLIYDVYQVIE